MSTDPREVAWHPRLRPNLIGHEMAEQHLLHALAHNKMHHGWLLSGPRGIGKATLAYRLAKFVLAGLDAQDAQSLAVAQNNPAVMRVGARGHGDLMVVERTVNERTGKLRQDIATDDARKVSSFFTLTASEGGWRVAIVDAADDLNLSSANALLKTLEEPPGKSLLILISHAPGRMLATIRSRVLQVKLDRLSNDQVLSVLADIGQGQDMAQEELAALVQLCDGSPGKALKLLNNAGAQHFLDFKKLAKGGFNRSACLQLCDVVGRGRDDEAFEVFCELFTGWLAENARANIQTSFELAGQPNAWAELFSRFSHSLAQTDALNLDRRQMLFEAFSEANDVLHA